MLLIKFFIGMMALTMVLLAGVGIGLSSERRTDGERLLVLGLLTAGFVLMIIVAVVLKA